MVCLAEWASSWPMNSRKNSTRTPIVTTLTSDISATKRLDAYRCWYIPKKNSIASQKKDSAESTGQSGPGRYTGSANHPHSNRAAEKSKLARYSARASTTRSVINSALRDTGGGRENSVLAMESAGVYPFGPLETSDPAIQPDSKAVLV